LWTKIGIVKKQQFLAEKSVSANFWTFHYEVVRGEYVDKGKGDVILDGKTILELLCACAVLYRPEPAWENEEPGSEHDVTGCGAPPPRKLTE
jgi:hypothetical protein